jgi:hypothetical protein
MFGMLWRSLGTGIVLFQEGTMMINNEQTILRMLIIRWTTVLSWSSEMPL